MQQRNMGAAAEGGEVMASEDLGRIIAEQTIEAHRRQREAMEELNLTPDQLKIGKALDREKVSAIKIVLLMAKPRLEREGLKNTRDTAQLCLDWLPTFDAPNGAAHDSEHEEKADG